MNALGYRHTCDKCGKTTRRRKTFAPVQRWVAKHRCKAVA